MEDHEKRKSLGADTAGKTDESTPTQTINSRGKRAPWIADGRERNKRIKNAVYDCTTLIPRTAIRVHLGQGTAFQWAIIRTPRALKSEEREAITNRLLDEHLIGQYWDDMEPTQHACVHFDAPRRP